MQDRMTGRITDIIPSISIVSRKKREAMRQLLDNLVQCSQEFVDQRNSWKSLGEEQGLVLRDESLLGVFERADAENVGIPNEIYMAVQQEGGEVEFVQYRLVEQKPEV